MEYLAYRTGAGLLRLAPERLALLFGEVLGWVAGVVLRIRWRTVREHLRRSFPEKDEGWRRRVARASYRHLGREAVATLRLSRTGPREVRERTRVEGLDALRDALEWGRGAIVVTGHFGNWEVGGAALTVRGVPLDVVAQRQRNPLFDADLTGTRERLGMRVILRGRAPREVLRSLRRGRCVAIVGDQNVRRGGLFVDFFGRPASTARGAAIFALRSHAPLFLALARREPGASGYRLTLERLSFTPSGDVEEDTLRLTRTHTRHLERAVRSTPEQYFWQHRRWKTRPPGES